MKTLLLPMLILLSSLLYGSEQNQVHELITCNDTFLNKVSDEENSPQNLLIQSIKYEKCSGSRIYFTIKEVKLDSSFPDQIHIELNTSETLNPDHYKKNNKKLISEVKNIATKTVIIFTDQNQRKNFIDKIKGKTPLSLEFDNNSEEVSDWQGLKVRFVPFSIIVEIQEKSSL